MVVYPPLPLLPSNIRIFQYFSWLMAQILLPKSCRIANICAISKKGAFVVPSTQNHQIIPI